jgi:hypothetical protein
MIRKATEIGLAVTKHSNPRRWREFFPYDIHAKAAYSDNDGGDRKMQVFAHARFDLESMVAGSGELLYLHIDTGKRVTGLILEPWLNATGRKSSTGLWRRVGTATLFEERTGSLLMQDVFESCGIRNEALFV